MKKFWFKCSNLRAYLAGNFFNTVTPVQYYEINEQSRQTSIEFECNTFLLHPLGWTYPAIARVDRCLEYMRVYENELQNIAVSVEVAIRNGDTYSIQNVVKAESI
jgi:hypothetical protein